MQGRDGHLKEFLLDSGLLSRAQLERASERAQERGEALTQALVGSGVLSEEEVRRAAAHAEGVPYVSLTRDNVESAALALIPEPLCRAHGCVAYAASERGVEVAFLDTTDLSALSFLAGRVRILPRLTSRDSHRRALLIYQKLLKESFERAQQGGEDKKILEALLTHASSQGASAIVLDSDDTGVRVRYRIGGALQEAMGLSAESGRKMLSRLRELGGASAQNTLPYEARIKMGPPLSALQESFSLRLTGFPHVHGEQVVLHIVKEGEVRKGYTLESLGFHGSGLEIVQRALHSSRGLIVVAGSTLSGVTTTLYTMLDIMNHPQKSLFSVEKHVEHRLPHVAQTEVSPAVGLTTLAALRAALRQDPDVVMVGEVDDTRTLEMIERASTRALMLVGISDSIDLPARGVTIRQRLMRKLCDQCAESQLLSRTEQSMLEERADFSKVLNALREEGVVGGQTAWKDLPFKRARGCSQCESGFKGFVGVHEVSLEGETELNAVEEALFKSAMSLVSLEDVLTVARGEAA